MPKRMLIDASHPEETRVVVLDGNKVEEFDFESASRRPLKGNIYLAKVTRVEPSLQAAFVEYGGNRQGFLAFSEIHPDYYQIPVADRIALLAAQTQRMMADEDEDFDSIDTASAPRQEPMLAVEAADEPVNEVVSETAEEHTEEAADNGAVQHEDAPPAARKAGVALDTDGESVPQPEDSAEADDSPASTQKANAAATHEEGGHEEGGLAEGADLAEGEPSAPQEAAPIVQTEATGAPVAYERRGPRQQGRPRPPRRRQYKIQEVIKRRQILLVQVVKEERGTKGASLTTFLSLAGRYCVLMPNTPRGGGISRKITSATDRKRLKSAAQSLELPEGMGLIIRTAGANRTKLEIKRDYEYLLRLWDTVRELTLKSNAPALVYEEGSLIKRAIRDLYNKDISEVLVDGEAGYRDAKDFMRMIMPSHAKNVKPYKEALPLFQRFQVESQLDAMFSPTLTLKSGGYIVINQTEALVSIDVNSGKATREHSIEETAHKTNLEAADEIARQLRLRDLAGLIVIDFIDMEDGKNDRNVEKRLHNAVRGDRARIQIGKISQFGLLEMSRQRLRAGVVAGSTVTCPHCAGLGIIRSTESAALRLLRALDEEGQRAPAAHITVKAPSDVAIYTLNQKRRELARIEEAYDLAVAFEPQSDMAGGSFELERTGARTPSPRPKTAAVSVEAGFNASESEQAPPQEVQEDAEIAEEPALIAREPERAEHPQPVENGGDGGEGARRKRRRRRRGGRGRSGQPPYENAHDMRGGQPHRDHVPMPESEAGMDAEPAASARDHREPEEAPQQRPANGGGPGFGAQNSPSQEGARRRRRRRGRRGRSRDGEQGTSMPAGDEDHATRVGLEAPRPDADESLGTVIREGGHGGETVIPNAPSSPQWSLNDRASEQAPREPELASLPPVERIEPEHRTRAQPEAEPASAAAQSEPPAEAPHETRKGWWQRRFKL